MLPSDPTRKLKGAHNIPIPTPLITAFLLFFMKRTPLFPPSRFPPPLLFLRLPPRLHFCFYRECKSRNIQIPSCSSPSIKSPGLSRRGSQANPIILQHNMAVGWVKYIFSASELRCKPGTDRDPFYILSGTGWWIGRIYSTGFVEERYFETCQTLITCLI